MYAVLDLKGHQYIIQKGDKIIVDRFNKEEGDIFDVETVLAVFDEEGKNVKVGTPYVNKAKAKLKVLSNVKGKKMDVIKFHNKNRYFRKIGFRPYQTILQIESIDSND